MNKVICTGYSIGITMGQIYEVKKFSRDERIKWSLQDVFIENDIGKGTWYMATLFMPLDEYRSNQIEKII